MKAKFTSSPWGFRYWDFEKYCKFMKKIGITDICIQFEEPDKFPLSFKTEISEIERHKKIAEVNGIKFLEAGITGNYRNEIPLTSYLGVKYLRVCEHWEESEESFRKVVEMLKDIGKLAERDGITVVVENHGGLTRTAKRCKELIEAIGLSSVKINYDPANFLYYGEDPVSAVDEILPHIGFTHFKSVKYENGKPKYCRLSEGVIDYKKVFEKLFHKNPSPFKGEGTGEGYTGYIGLEYEEPDDVEAGTLDDFEYLKKLFKEG